MKKIYVYQINFDENCTFYAEVLESENLRGDSIFDVNPWERGGKFFFQGYGMKHKNDTEGLEKFLKKIGVIEQDAVVLSSEEFRKQKSNCSAT